MAMQQTRFPNLPSSELQPTFLDPKEERRRARNREAQRNHREFVSQIVVGTISGMQYLSSWSLLLN